MKKTEFVYREVLFQALERKQRKMTQAKLSETLGISLSTVNNALKPLKEMGAVRIGKMNFVVLDARKILLHWASKRHLARDVVYSTCVEGSVKEIERQVPDDAVFAAYSAYKLRFKDVPADYGEVWVYGSADELRKRFPDAEDEKGGKVKKSRQGKKDKKGVANLFVLKKDVLMERYGKTTTLAQTFVDLWNLDAWYAAEFVKALEAKLAEALGE